MNHDTDRTRSFRVDKSHHEERLDQYLASQGRGLTRSRVQDFIRRGYVQVNERLAKPSHRLKSGDRVALSVPAARPYFLEPEQVDFSVVYEDRALLVVNKPAGLVSHPAPGHYGGTLVHGLLHRCKDFSGLGGELRPGIVHRLDKDTSGLMVVVKSDRAHAFLSAQFKARKVLKEYVAIVHGMVRGEQGIIEAPISRHPLKRKQMAVTSSGGRDAVTHWKREEALGGCCSLLLVRPKTGRTHQIRVHLSHAGHPIAGDPVYGFRKTWWKKHFPAAEEVVTRQMLHAGKLGFVHPDSRQYCEFTAPLPEDMQRVLDLLRKGRFSS